MAKIFRPNPAKPQTPEDVFMTTAQIRKRYKVTDLEIHELERKGYLTHFLLNRKAKRYWRADVEAGVHAFCNDLPAPSPNYKHWAAAGSVDTDLSFLSFLKLYRTDVVQC